MRRCCNNGCVVQAETLADIKKGYRVSFGFMLWACPEHAAIWQEFDEKNRQYDRKRNDDFQVAYKEFEEAWERKFKLENPPPLPPKYQASV